MATLNEISVYICSRVGQALNTVLQEEVKFAIKAARAELIRRDVERNGMSKEFAQRFTVPLSVVDKADSCVVDVGCDVLRTTGKIPKPVRIKSDSPFIYVGSADGCDTWTHTEFEELKYTKFNKYTSNITRYNYTNGYLYIYLAKGLTRVKYATIEEVAVNPSEAVNLCIDTANCYTDDESFPIGEDMLRTVIEIVLKQISLKKETDTEVEIENEQKKP